MAQMAKFDFEMSYLVYDQYFDIHLSENAKIRRKKMHVIN